MTEVVRGDASRVGELEPLWLALREHQGAVTPEWGELRPAGDGWARRRADYADILSEGGALFLAVEDGALAGYAICEQEEGRSPTWRWPATFLAVVDLVVAPDRRGRGTGEALMAAAEQEARARGVEALDLMVTATNEPARRLYERLGMRADLITYRKPLS